jgi:hypothetical protein
LAALATARGPVLDEAADEPGSEEARFRAAQTALSSAEAAGSTNADVLVEFVEAAWRTGRRNLGMLHINAMLKKAAMAEKAL